MTNLHTALARGEPRGDKANSSGSCFGVWVLLVLVIPAAMVAAPSTTGVSQEIQLVGSLGRATITLQADSALCPGLAPRQLAASVPGTVQVEVSGCSSWRLACSGVWFCSASLNDPGPAELPVILDVYPAVRVMGRLEVPRVEALPDQVVISGRARQVGEAKEPVDFELTAEVGENGAIAFNAPVSPVDLRIAAHAMAPAYRWKAWPRDGVIELGVVELAPGGSLLGYVVDAQTGFPVVGATLRVVPAGLDELPIADRDARVSLPAPVARSDERGGFQLVALPPGAYRLIAEHPGYLASKPAEVSVVRDAETILGGDVVLSRPLRLRLVIDPPLSPEGRRWEAVLRDSATSTDVASTRADEEGVAEFESLEPASLRLELGTERIMGAHSMDLELVADQELFVDIPLVEILGYITMEDEPIHGNVKISTGASDSWQLSLNEEGRFSSWIRDPRFDFLFLEISGEGFAFPARVVAEDVAVRKGKIKIEVELLDLEISGKVVDLQGKSVAGADVDVRQDGQPVAFTVSLADGSFSIRPLQAGEYMVDATQLAVGTSQQEILKLSELSPTMETTLVILPSRRLVGRVAGPGGEAVGGARVMTLSVGPNYVSHTGQTDANGRFVAEVAAEARQAVVLVVARGYPFWSACLPATRALAVQLPAAGGWLELALGDDAEPGEPVPGLPLLVNDSGGLGLYTEVLRWSSQNGGGEVTLGEGGTVFRIPSVAPGRWAMVWSTGAHAEEVAAACGALLLHGKDWQTLNPGGTARLKRSE